MWKWRKLLKSPISHMVLNMVILCPRPRTQQPCLSRIPDNSNPAIEGALSYWCRGRRIQQFRFASSGHWILIEVESAPMEPAQFYVASEELASEWWRHITAVLEKRTVTWRKHLVVHDFFGLLILPQVSYLGDSRRKRKHKKHSRKHRHHGSKTSWSL